MLSHWDISLSYPFLRYSLEDGGHTIKEGVTGTERRDSDGSATPSTAAETLSSADPQNIPLVTRTLSFSVLQSKFKPQHSSH